MKRYFRITLYSLCAMLIGVIVGIGITRLTSMDKNDETNMITLLSIIVTLGVAYSFYSIYKVTNEFENLKRKTNNIQQQLRQESSSLRNDICKQREDLQRDIVSNTKLLGNRAIALARQLTLFRRDSWASSSYENRRFLLTIKQEIETLEFVLLNSEYLTGELLDDSNEVERSIGAKRALISNDILMSVRYLTNDKVAKFKKNEFNDSKDAIKRAIYSIQNPKLWTLINDSEKVRYSFLFNILHDFLRVIELKKLPFPLNDEDKLRLIFYHDFISDGALSDEELRYEEWKNNYVKIYGINENTSCM